MVNSGLEVIGDIGKKTYSIFIEDDEDSSAARRPNVSLSFVPYQLMCIVICAIFTCF